MAQMHQRQNRNFQQQQIRRKKKLNANMILSLCFIFFIIISFLVIFAINGRDADDASAIPTLLPNTQVSSSTAGNGQPSPTPTVPTKKVLIDPGHGGFDVGTLGSENMANEDDLNLAIALKVGNYLSELGITPVYTRTDDGPVADTKEEDMQERVNLINSSGALMAVSIHMNSYPADSSVKGPEVYYYDGNASTQKSTSIAANMQSALNTACNGRRSSKHGDFMVLREAHIPAILIECGFLSNPTEEANLNSEAYQNQLAQAIANCIVQNLS